MIEVEVELDMQVPDAEVANIEDQIAKLYEVEELQREWQAQVQANDEVRGGDGGCVGLARFEDLLL